jgi:hypothetical protein
MATLHMTDRADPRTSTMAIRATVVALTLLTAAIHASLGGLMFMANAAGYATLALAMVLPGPIGQIRWLVRLALLGFTAATIGGWVLFGTRFPLAYFDKAVELGLVAMVSLELWRSDGGPVGVIRQARGLMARLAGPRAGRIPR